MWNNHCEISFPALSAALAALGFFSPSLGLSQEGKNLKSRDGVNTGKYIVEKAEKATVFGMYESIRHPRWEETAMKAITIRATGLGRMPRCRDGMKMGDGRMQKDSDKRINVCRTYLNIIARGNIKSSRRLTTIGMPLARDHQFFKLH